MRNIRKTMMSVLMLGMALLLSVFPYIEAFASPYVPAETEAYRSPAVPMQEPEPTAANLIHIDSQTHPAFLTAERRHTIGAPAPARAMPAKPAMTHSIPAPISASLTAPASAPIPSSMVADDSPDADSSPAILKRAPVAPYETYITTAYYLNVREKASSESKILKVVEKGDVLNVSEAMDNGWLALHEGGFVHGAYAEAMGIAPAAAEAKVKAPLAAAVVGIAAMDPADAARDAATVASDFASDPASTTASKPRKPTSKVQSDSGLTEAHIGEILQGTALEDPSLAAAILEIEDEYGINAFFTIAVMKLESGNGKSKLAKTKNNLFGLNATGGSNSKAFSFDTKADSVRKFGQLIAESYVDKGYTTIEKVAKKYCPPNGKWPSLIKKIMHGDHGKLSDSRLL